MIINFHEIMMNRLDGWRLKLNERRGVGANFIMDGRNYALLVEEGIFLLPTFSNFFQLNSEHR